MHVLVYHGTPRLYPEIGATARAEPGGDSSACGSGTPDLDKQNQQKEKEKEKEKEKSEEKSEEKSGASELGIAAIRFPRPVRLSALRIIPAGVVHPTGVGETDVKAFMAELFLNVSPSDPVNALVRTSAAVWPAEHALEFALDMPPGTTTRLVIVRAPASKVTMSLYAEQDDTSAPASASTSASVSAPVSDSSPASASASAASSLAQTPTPPTRLPLPPTTDLLAAIPSLPTAPPEIRARALATLAAMARRSCILADVLDSGHADALLALEGSGAAVRSVLGLQHQDGDVRALAALTRLAHPSAASFPHPESQLDLALRLARAQQESTHPQAGAALRVVVERVGHVMANLRDEDKLVADRLARALAVAAVHATARGSETPIPVPPASSHARTVARTLLTTSAEATVDGRACAPAAARLMRPFLPALGDDAIRFAWEAPSLTSSPSLSLSLAPPSPAPGSPTPTGDTTGITSLHRALTAPSASLALTPTPAEVLAVLAPGLLAALATAPAPPLGIPPALPSGTSGSASDYAGKVYSAHEFRRERDTVWGLGIGLAGVGRKASRHVDEFR